MTEKEVDLVKEQAKSSQLESKLTELQDEKL